MYSDVDRHREFTSLMSFMKCGSYAALLDHVVGTGPRTLDGTNRHRPR